MENLNAEQVKKTLECCFAETMRCEECPRYDACREGVGFDMPKYALALINSQEQRIKELTEENERLSAENADCRLGFTLLEDAFQRLEKINEQTEADTLENIKIQFAMRFGTYCEKDQVKIADVFRLLDQIAKELKGE